MGKSTLSTAPTLITDALSKDLSSHASVRVDTFFRRIFREVRLLVPDELNFIKTPSEYRNRYKWCVRYATKMAKQPANLSGRIIGATPVLPQEQTRQEKKSATSTTIMGCY